MRLQIITLLVILLVCAPTWAQDASTGFPCGDTDPVCSAGDGFMWCNTTDHFIKKCENGTITVIGSNEVTTTNQGPGTNAYNPDRRPTSGTYAPCTDEFKNGVDDAGSSFSTANVSSMSTTLAGDYMKFSDTNDTGTHAWACTPSNAADWTITAKVLVYGSGTPSNFGLVFIDGGSLATPTLVVGFVLRRTALSTGDVLVGTKAAWTTAAWTAVSTTDTVAGPNYTDNRHTYCLQARYVVATKVMNFRFAADCRNWQLNATATRTFTNAPGAAGLGIESPASGNTTVTVQWIRTRTDAAGASGEFLVGQ